MIPLNDMGPGQFPFLSIAVESFSSKMPPSGPPVYADLVCLLWRRSLLYTGPEGEETHSGRDCRHFTGTSPILCTQSAALTLNFLHHSGRFPTSTVAFFSFFNTSQLLINFYLLCALTASFLFFWSFLSEGCTGAGRGPCPCWTPTMVSPSPTPPPPSACNSMVCPTH